MATPMTPDQLLKALKDEGLTVVEYTGWRSRCRCCSGAHKASGPYVRGWGDVNGTVTHITAGGLGGRTVEQYIASIINGDKAVPTKSQFVVAPDGKVYLNSAGRCNHAGKVGAAVKTHLRAADFSISDDFDNRFTGGAVDGNSFTYGIENIAASSMTAAQRAASVKINAAIARHYGWTGQESVGHGEISNQRGKGDPNLDMGAFRRDVMLAVKAGPKGSTKPVTPKPPVAVTPAEPKPTPAETIKVRALFLPMAGYNGDKARGVTDWRRNTDGLAKVLRDAAPDVFGTTELSNRGINPMKPRFEKAIVGYSLEHGTDGRYVGRRKATTNHVGGGVVVAPALAELNDDDKQGAWSVEKIGSTKIGVISIHTENEDGIDKAGPNKGANADDLRVAQMLQMVGSALTKIAAHGVDDEHVIAMADTNSESWVKDAMVKAGWTAVGPGFYTGWDDTSKKSFDWVFIKSGSATSRVINHDFGDHTAIVVDWTLEA